MRLASGRPCRNSRSPAAKPATNDSFLPSSWALRQHQRDRLCGGQARQEIDRGVPDEAPALRAAAVVDLDREAPDEVVQVALDGAAGAAEAGLAQPGERIGRGDRLRMARYQAQQGPLAGEGVEVVVAHGGSGWSGVAFGS